MCVCPHSDEGCRCIYLHLATCSEGKGQEGQEGKGRKGQQGAERLGDI